jgi:hypothetical protein
MEASTMTSPHTKTVHVGIVVLLPTVEVTQTSKVYSELDETIQRDVGVTHEQPGPWCVEQ